jgi:hypothetical protein
MVTSNDDATLRRANNNEATQARVIYLTQARLMSESERTVEERARWGEEIYKRLCSQLLADVPRYSLWHSRHARHMSGVAEARQRDRQILSLRALSVEQVHQAALVRYFRDRKLTGAARDQTLREFYGVTDPREAAVLEHRRYQLAASTQLCAAEILEIVGDRPGLVLVGRYQAAYDQYFGLFCERARSRENGKRYLLENLLPEQRAAAEQLRLEILNSRLAARPVAVKTPVKAQGRAQPRAAATRVSKLFHPRA